MNTTDEIVSIIKSATPVEMICIHAIVKIVAPDPPPIPLKTAVAN